MSIKQGNKLYADGRYNDAINEYRKIDKSSPVFREAQFNISHIERLLNRRNSQNTLKQKNEQAEQFSTVSEVVARIEVLTNEGNARQATQLIAKLSEPHRQSVEIMLWAAKVALVDGRFKDSVVLAQEVQRQRPELTEAYKVAEQAAIELGDFAQANSFFLSQPAFKNPKLPRKRDYNPVLPRNFILPPIIGAGNDYRHILERVSLFAEGARPYQKIATVVVPVYNRKQILANTLAALIHQTYPKNLLQIVVADDGSEDDVITVVRKYESKLNLLYARQRDDGYRLAAARNIGIRVGNGDATIFMDADILPAPSDIETYMRVMHVADDAVLIGHRRYVDVSGIRDDDIAGNIDAVLKLPSINPNNDVADKRNAKGESIDWRLPIYEQTNGLMNDLWPFTKGAGGNLAIPRQLIERAGLVDEAFQAWGCEDTEYNYRLYSAGAYFIPMMDIMSLHQEPLQETAKAAATETGSSFRAKGHQITRAILAQKCPAPTTRRYTAGAKFEIPKVSIYIPAYNAAEFITEAVESCLDQQFGDLEVCICDDGSTDETAVILEKNFGNNPKVRWRSQPNGGIGKATNTALRMCRGLYVGQLDADDRLKPGAVAACTKVLDTQHVDAVYTDCDYIDRAGNYIRDGWCGGEFSRDWLATGMIATHFRMFRRRLVARIPAVNETIANAVDLDLWLKINERAHIAHLHEVLYSYRWHGRNTSIKDRKKQETNHLFVVRDSLRRLELDQFWEVRSTGNPLNPREFRIEPRRDGPEVNPKDVLLLIPTCVPNRAKMEAVRDTWAKRLKKYEMKHYFLIGDPARTIAQAEGDVIYVPCEDNYESLLLKLSLGYEFALRNLEFKYVYKIDDDCFLNVDKLVADIIPQLKGSQYCGGQVHPKGASMNNRWHFGKCSDPKFDKPYKFDKAPFSFAKGGYGYFLRRDALPAVCGMIAQFRQELTEGIYSFEDVRISELMGERGIHVLKLAQYDVSREKDRGDLKNDIVKYDIGNPFVFKEMENAYVNLQMQQSEVKSM